MREILFRGKRVNDGEWVEGFYAYIEFDDRHVIITQDTYTEYGGLYYFTADPATIGQYTGLTDKNGKRIFEGDVVRFTERHLGGEDVPVVEAVEFAEGGFATHRYFLNNWLRNAAKENCQLQDIKVVGNIHDNPELLEGGEG